MNVRGVCRTCGADGQFALHHMREMMFGSREAFPYLECASCGSLQIQTIPADLARHYPPNYLSPGESVGGSARTFLRRQRTAYLLRGRNPIGWVANRLKKDDLRPHLLSLRHIPSLGKKRTVLDVGCGPGHLLHRLLEIGYQHLAGQDPFQQSTLRGLKVHAEPLADLTGQFDLIMLHHSLEHTPDPLQVFVDLKKLSAPDGSILVRIPVAASAAWSQYGVNWYQADAPRHLVIPSGEGMRMLARRAGLEIFRVEYDSDETQFLCSEQYRRDIPLRDARSYYRNPNQALFTPLEIADAKTKALEVNRRKQGDQACFYLRSPS
jgi:SAM-dependent methyltransferase